MNHVNSLARSVMHWWMRIRFLIPTLTRIGLIPIGLGCWRTGYRKSSVNGLVQNRTDLSIRFPSRYLNHSIRTESAKIQNARNSRWIGHFRFWNFRNLIHSSQIPTNWLIQIPMMNLKILIRKN